MRTEHKGQVGFRYLGNEGHMSVRVCFPNTMEATAGKKIAMNLSTVWATQAFYLKSKQFFTLSQVPSDPTEALSPSMDTHSRGWKTPWESYMLSI